MARSNQINYKKIYAMKKSREDRIKKLCPDIPYSPGIYAFYRTDENGIRRAYVGQAISLCERCAAHLAEYDHIALSLKKYGLFDSDNPNGWKLQYKRCPKEELDEKEIATIKAFANDGFQMYNVTAGGQGKGKKQLNEYKQPKTYRQGVEQGKKIASREVAHLFEKHLNYSTKNNPPTRYQRQAVDKFENFLNEDKMPEDNGAIDTERLEKEKYGKTVFSGSK